MRLSSPGLVVITGASSAIGGGAIAVALSEGGHDLALFGRDAGRLDATRQRCGSVPRAAAYPFDLTSEAATLEAVARLRAGQVEPRVLVHAAGLFD